MLRRTTNGSFGHVLHSHEAVRTIISTEIQITGDGINTSAAQSRLQPLKEKRTIQTESLGWRELFEREPTNSKLAVVSSLLRCCLAARTVLSSALRTAIVKRKLKRALPL